LIVSIALDENVDDIDITPDTATRHSITDHLPLTKMTKEMNTEALHIVLQQSFSPDAALRDPAERTIANLKNVKGASVMLLQVAAEKQVHRHDCFIRPLNTRNLTCFHSLGSI
jgi:hypothetical protein